MKFIAHPLTAVQQRYRVGQSYQKNVRAYAREDMAGSHRELSEDIIGIKKLASRAQNLIACVQRLVMAGLSDGSAFKTGW